MMQAEYSLVCRYGTLEEIQRANVIMSQFNTSIKSKREEIREELETLVSVCKEREDKEDWK